MRFPSALALPGTIFLAITTAAFAQSTTSLHGAISDVKGGVITNASVTLGNSATGFSRTTKTDGQGAYQFLQVPPATYQLLVQAAGFAPLKQDNVVLQVSSPATLNITVAVKGTTEVVEVTGSAPLVNTQDASQGHVFDSIQLTRLPSEGRDPVSILSLQPGVTYTGKHDHDTQDNDSRGGAVSGGRSDQANIMLDGLDNNDQLFGYAFEGALRATLDSLQEFRVTTTNANADAGRSSGAQVNLVTKTGTNAWHGTLYEYHRPTFTAANDPFNKQAQLKAGLPNIPGKVLRNTFGGTVGGPIKKDRAFFFLAYEGDRLRESTQTTRTIPSDDLRNGIVHYPCDTTEDPDNCKEGAPKPGVTVTSASGLGATELLVTMDQGALAAIDTGCTVTCPEGGGANQAVLDVFKQYPSPNTDAAGDGLDYRGFTFAAPNPNNLNTYIAKLDFKLTPNGNHSVFIRGNLQNDRILTAPQFPTLPANETRTANNKGIAVGYTALLSNTFINNFRYSFVRQGNGDIGLSTANIADFRGLDDPQGYTRSTINNVPVQNFVDDVSWTKGKHTFQFGTNWRLVGNNRQSDLQSNSSALTNVYWLDNAALANTGQGSSLDPATFKYPLVSDAFSVDYDFAVAAVTGLLPEVDTVYNQDKTGTLIPNGQMVPRHFHSFEGELYFQDSWRVTPHLVLTGGLRYSLLQPPYETNGNQAAPDISLNQFFKERGKEMVQGEVFRPTITLGLSGKANGGQPYWNWDYRNLAPRFAFAYSPHSESGFWHKLFGGAGKSSIRAGYGLYFDHFGQGVVNTFDRQGSFGLTTILLNPAATQSVDCTPRFTALTEVPNGTFCGQNMNPPAPGTFPVTPPGGTQAGSFAIYWGLDDKLKTPYSHVFDFSLTRELPKQFALEISYTGRLARRLLQESDLAAPLDLVDTKSGMDYFQAATLLAKAAEKNVNIKDLAPIAYWEDMFPTAAFPKRPLFGCEGKMKRAEVTATQAMYDTFSCYLHNETSALFLADTPQFRNGDCIPACSTVNGETGPFHFFHDQFSSLYAWRSQGTSSYHALQASIRHAMARGLQFDFNYTYSKSIDIGSNAERINQYESSLGGFGSQVINAWSPAQLRSVSDFDTTHQFNANWIYELPVGKGKTFGNGWGSAANAIVGGWSLSGLARWTSGFPFTIYAGDGWATNWELQGTSFLVGNPGAVGGVYRDPETGDPNMFQMAITDQSKLHDQFRSTYPGESGQRNNFRGPGYFGVDLGLGKTWAFRESQNAEFRWEVFNATNSVRFDAASSAVNESLSDSGSFGKYQSTLTTARRMQFSLRYTF